MCVCACVCVHVLCVHMSVHVCVCMCVCVHVCVYMSVHVCMCMCVCACVCAHECACVYVHVCVCAWWYQCEHKLHYVVPWQPLANSPSATFANVTSGKRLAAFKLGRRRGRGMKEESFFNPNSPRSQDFSGRVHDDVR